jgi:DinB superfamily
VRKIRSADTVTAMVADPQMPAPDDKDWTWVLDAPCPDCGFDASAVGHGDIPRIIRETVASFEVALSRQDAATRRSPAVWSTLEYGCHVRDVAVLYAERLRLMLTEYDPQWSNWDQDETAVRDRYWAQDPGTVARDLAEAGERLAAAFESVDALQWARPGRRSNGSVFTVESFSRYLAHDYVHHVHDIGG